ncbi:MAG: hypothetical protein ACR2KX_20895 [Chitinophagaceae bacterium]
MVFVLTTLAYTKVFNEDTKATFGVDKNKLLSPTSPQIRSSGTSADSIPISI